MRNLWICVLILMMIPAFAGCTVTESEKKAGDGDVKTGAGDASGSGDVEADSAMRLLAPSIIEMDAFMAVGLEIEVDFIDTSPIHDIRDRFDARMDDIGGYGPAMGISFTQHTSFIYFACQKVESDENIPERMKMRAIPTATYASFPFEGQPEEMENFMILIKRDFLPASGRVADPDNTIIIEMYPPDAYDEVTNELVADIYIPIKPEEDSYIITPSSGD